MSTNISKFVRLSVWYLDSCYMASADNLNGDKSYVWGVLKCYRAISRPCVIKTLGVVDALGPLSFIAIPEQPTFLDSNPTSTWVQAHPNSTTVTLGRSRRSSTSSTSLHSSPPMPAPICGIPTAPCSLL